MRHRKALVSWALLLVCFAGALGQTRASVAEVVDPRNADYPARFRATSHLGTKLSSDDSAMLCSFLIRLPEDDVAKADELPVLKNNVADALLGQTSVPDALLDALVAGFSDGKQGEVWREYAVQKVPEFCLRSSDDDRRKQALQFLRDRAVDPKYIYAGTAVLGLNRVRMVHPDWVTSSEVARLAEAILASDRHALANKISALHVLSANDAARGRQEALRCLRDDAPINLQASALAIIGDVGLLADRTLVESFVEHPDIRLRTAATAAIARFNARLAPVSGR